MGTPAEVWSTLTRCWEVAPTSERIVEDISKFEYARGTSAELAAEVRAETEQARTQARNGQRKRACE